MIKAGVGRAEDTVTSGAAKIIVILSISVTFVSNLGLIAITIWSFFVLPWLPTLGVIAIALFGFSFLSGMLLGIWRRGALSFYTTHKHEASGLPIQVRHSAISLYHLPKDRNGLAAQKYQDAHAAEAVAKALVHASNVSNLPGRIP